MFASAKYKDRTGNKKRNCKRIQKLDFKLEPLIVSSLAQSTGHNCKNLPQDGALVAIDEKNRNISKTLERNFVPENSLARGIQKSVIMMFMKYFTVGEIICFFLQKIYFFLIQYIQK